MLLLTQVVYNAIAKFDDCKFPSCLGTQVILYTRCPKSHCAKVWDCVLASFKNKFSEFFVLVSKFLHRLL